MILAVFVTYCICGALFALLMVLFSEGKTRFGIVDVLLIMALYPYYTVRILTDKKRNKEI